MGAVELLATADSESRRLAAVSEQASDLFRTLGEDMAAVLADRFVELKELAAAAATDRRANRTRADMEAFLPTVIQQLRAMTTAVEQLLAAGQPLVDAAARLEITVPKVD